MDRDQRTTTLMTRPNKRLNLHTLLVMVLMTTPFTSKRRVLLRVFFFTRFPLWCEEPLYIHVLRCAFRSLHACLLKIINKSLKIRVISYFQIIGQTRCRMLQKWVASCFTFEYDWRLDDRRRGIPFNFIGLTTPPAAAAGSGAAPWAGQAGH